MAFRWPWQKKDSQKALQSVDDRTWTRIFDWTPGAWQTHDPYSTTGSVLEYPAVFSCTTLISGDIAKLPFHVQQQKDGIWGEVDHATLKLLKRPNKYQNQIQFKEHWVLSKLLHGNTYVLKVRDGMGKVEGLIVLDPLKVYPLVADNGDVYYRLNDDDLSMIESQIVVPSSEIIHDRFNCLYHPLVGLSPIFASEKSAEMGNYIIRNSRGFFKNGVNPSGILTAPGNISDETANRLKEHWESNYTGEKSGSVVAVGDDLKFEQVRMSNIDAQVIEHFGWTSETVCSVYHVPPFKIGMGQMPTYNNVEVLNIEYYSTCLQKLIEDMEECLNTGLDFQARFRIQVNLDGLFRMDQSTLVKMLAESTKGAIHSPNEARARLNLPPVKGGELPYLQQQNYSLEALAQRDADDPFKKPEPPPVPEEPEPEDMEEAAKHFGALIKSFPVEFKRPAA